MPWLIPSWTSSLFPLQTRGNILVHECSLPYNSLYLLRDPKLLHLLSYMDFNTRIVFPFNLKPCCYVILLVNLEGRYFLCSFRGKFNHFNQIQSKGSFLMVCPPKSAHSLLHRIQLFLPYINHQRNFVINIFAFWESQNPFTSPVSITVHFVSMRIVFSRNSPAPLLWDFLC